MPHHRRPPHIRRQMIIAAAREKIASQGMHATTIRDIAGAADVAVGTITYHFSGIAEVLAGVLESEMAEYSADIMAASAAAPTGAAGLRILTDGLLADGDRAAEHWKLWLDFWTLAAHQQHYAQWQEQVYVDLHGLARELLGRADDDGSLRVADPRQSAIDYIAMMDGLVVQAYLPRTTFGPAQARASLWGYVTAMFAPESSAAGAEPAEAPAGSSRARLPVE